MRSPAPYWVLAVFAVFLKLELLRDGAYMVWEGVGALVVSVGLLFVAKAVLDRTVFSRCHEQPVALWVVVAVGVLLGVISVAPFVGALAWAGTGINEPPFMGILVSGALRCGLVFPVATYLAGLREWYATERRRAERDLVRAEAARMEAGDAVDATRGLIIEAARRELGSSQREAAELLQAAVRSEAPDDMSRAAESLRTAARSAVRSTSHDLWVDGRSAASIRWRSVVPGAIVRYPLPVLLAGLIVFTFVLVRSDLVANPRPGGSAAALVAGFLLVATYLLGRQVIHRAPRAAAVVTVAAVVGAPVAAQFVAGAILERAPTALPLVAMTAVVAVATVASSVALMIRDSGAAVIQALVDDRAREDAQQAALQMINARLSRELATHLHGTVQPELVAASAALDAAVGEGDPAAIAAAVARAEAALGMDVDAPFAVARARPAGEVVAAVRGRWDSLLDLRIQVAATGGEGATALLPDGVARVIDECLNNAVVHGGATHASVRIAAADGGWALQVVDNGLGPAGGVPGLGSALLDEITLSEWSIAAGPGGGAVVRATIPDRTRTPTG